MDSDSPGSTRSGAEVARSTDMMSRESGRLF
jgi:hypothetical protein